MNPYESGVIKYQINYESYKNGIANEVIRLLDNANIEIAGYIKKTQSVATKARYKQIAKKLNEISKQLKERIEQNIDVDAVIAYELKKENNLFEKVKKFFKGDSGKISFIYPSVEQIKTSALFRPATDGLTFQSYLDSIEAGLFNTWDSAVRTGYLTGIPTRQIVSNVVGGVSQIDKLKKAGTLQPFRNNVYANTRTLLQSFAEEARERVYRENEQYFGDGEFKYEWLSALDSRTCLICGNLDGKLFKTIESAQPIPRHRNCVLGDTLVSTVGSISKVYRRRYKGLVYRITTASGNVLTVTPNHPILTDKGFVRAHLLNVGDNVVSDNGLETLGIIGKNKDNRKARIKDVFSTFRKSPFMFTVSVPTTTEDFHSDSTHKKVDIVCTDRVLSDKGNVSGFKNIGKKFFVFRHLRQILLNKSKKCVVFSFFKRNLSAFRNLMSRCSKLCNLFFGRMFHPFNLLFVWIPLRDIMLSKKGSHSSSSITKSLSDSCNSDSLIVKFKYRIDRKIVSRMLSRSADVSLMQDVSDDVFGRTVLASNIFDRYSTQIKVDNIVAIDVKFAFTHVYNLETENSWYVANGIITHNCRCILLPYFDIEGDKRASKDGYVDSKTTFNKWLGDQDEKTQREVLGATRYKMYKDGVKIEQFLDNGRVLTLDELYEQLDLEE